MTSNNLRRCCTIGAVHEGQPKGELSTLGGVETYFAYPESKSRTHAILFLTDVIGHRAINAQLLADQFAANGYFVAVPALFGGDPIQLNRPADAGPFDFNAWYQRGRGGKGHGPDQVDPIVEACLAELKGKHGVQRVAAAGYCFGAKYVVRFLAEGKGVDVGYIAHPGLITPEELKAVKGPLSLAAAETDEIFPAEKRHETEDLLKGLGATYQISLYSQVAHGFAVRGDMTKPVVKFAKEAAFVQAVAWFDEFLKHERSWAA